MFRTINTREFEGGQGEWASDIKLDKEEYRPAILLVEFGHLIS